MNKKSVLVKDAKILILGITFKENCPDIRNSKVVDIYSTLQEYTKNIDVYDPWANRAVVKRVFGIDLLNIEKINNNMKYDVVIHAVAHNQFKDLNIRDFLRENGVVYDVKGVLNREMIDGRL